MAALNPVLVVTDTPTNSQSAGTTSIVTNVQEFSVTWRLGQSEDISYRAIGQDAATHLTPGRPPTGARVIAPSLDGGTTKLSRMLSNGAAWKWGFPITVEETGKGLGQVLAMGRVGRLSVQQVTLRDVLTAAAGQMRQQASPPNTITSSTRIPDMVSLGAIPLGPAGTSQATAVAFTFVVGAAVAQAVLDLDSNRDSVLRATETVVEHLGSASVNGALLDPAYAQFVIDSGDYGVIEGVRQSKTLTVGHKGTASQLTFDGTSAGVTTQMVLRASSGQSQTTDQLSSCSIRGGDTHHGVPSGGKITCVKTINGSLPGNGGGGPSFVGGYSTGMPILGIYASRAVGGVYGWFGDGLLHPISQAMGVNDLWYDASQFEIDAATDAGVYRAVSDPFIASRTPWPRLGAMALKTTKLCKTAGVLYALVDYANAGGTHILRYPAIDSSGANAGFAGWSHVYGVAGIDDFTVMGSVLYYSTATAGTDAAVHVYVIGTARSGKALPIPKQVVAGDTVVIGLDPITDVETGATVVGTFVRTSGGSSNFYYLAVLGGLFGAPLQLIAAGSGLVDDSGAPVMVNHVDVHTALNISWSNGDTTSAYALASTGRGIYAGALQSSGFVWRRTDGQCNLGDFTVLACASAPPRTVQGRVLTNIYGVTDSAIYWSPNGTVSFIDVTAQILDAGPAFYAAFKRKNGAYPSNAPASLRVPDPVRGPFTLTRILLGTGEFDYILSNPASTAPGWAHRDTSIAEISALANVPEIPLSEFLILAMVRLLNWTKDPQMKVIVESSFDDTTDALVSLRPSQLVLLNAVVEECITGVGDITYATYSNEPFFVLDHTIRVSNADGEGEGPGVGHTVTTLGKLLLDDRTDALRVTADLWYTVSKLQSMRSKGRR